MEKQERNFYTKLLAFRRLVGEIVLLSPQPLLSHLAQEETEISYEIWQDVERSFKELRKKLYSKEYQKKYLKRKVRKWIFFEKEEIRFLEKEAKKHKKRFSFFLKEIILSYCKNRHKYIVPNEEEIQSLGLGIRRIGNNINQIAMHTNYFRSLSLFDAQEIGKKLRELEELIYDKLKSPPVCSKCSDDCENNALEGLQHCQINPLLGKGIKKK